ncbi:MAG: beta-N-acetylhexosaminidase [Actinomycetota bacterium]|jgi:beta-N-acetylhexosaminidase|nr:beta-N-acetylhexosaminidase [Actinomycetota bacterium]
MTSTRGRLCAALAVTLVVLASPTATAQAAVPTGGASAVLSRMTLAQRVGQLFMVGTPATAAGSSTLSAISAYHVGNIMLTGRSHDGTAAVAAVTGALSARVTTSSTYGVPLFIGTDQEGGLVQVLSGPGFSTMPTALTQGTWSPTNLRTWATTWGRQLRTAGVNVNLAPVMDTVPLAYAAYPPIGYYRREFGHTTSVVASHGTAFVAGMSTAGVVATAKHFPGLGRVTANPDTTSRVTDRVTVRHDAYLWPFAAAVSYGVPFLMMSTAYYQRIDPYHPAAFSPTIIGGMVRGDLAFRGVVISDDLSNAVQVAAWSPASRALQFINAGGDMILATNPAVLPAMYGAVLARAQANAAFLSKVDASALRVLTAKQNRGLIPRAT